MLHVLKWVLHLSLARVVLAQAFDIKNAVSSDGLVHGNDRVIDRIFREPRPYDIILIMTAEDSKYHCGFCSSLGPELREVAQSYNAQNPDRKLYFLLGDLDYSQQTFQALSLTTAPNLYWYPAETDPAIYKRKLQAPREQVQFTTNGPQTQYLVTLLNRKGFPVKIDRPVRWDRIGNAIGTVIFAAAGAWAFWPKVVAVYQSKKLWLAVTLVLTLVFISGHMFNITRRTPFMGASNGKPEYIQPGYGGQFAVETQILSVIYAILAFCSILLMTRVPSLPESRQLYAGVLLSLAILVTFSVLIGVFKVKNPGFPFTLIDIKV